VVSISNGGFVIDTDRIGITGSQNAAATITTSPGSIGSNINDIVTPVESIPLASAALISDNCPTAARYFETNINANAINNNGGNTGMNGQEILFLKSQPPTAAGNSSTGRVYPEANPMPYYQPAVPTYSKSMKRNVHIFDIYTIHIYCYSIQRIILLQQ
jgi:hypothetical protein